MPVTDMKFDAMSNSLGYVRRARRGEGSWLDFVLEEKKQEDNRGNPPPKKNHLSESSFISLMTRLSLYELRSTNLCHVKRVPVSLARIRSPCRQDRGVTDGRQTSTGWQWDATEEPKSPARTQAGPSTNTSPGQL